jgi:hypothetical protein
MCAGRSDTAGPIIERSSLDADNQADKYDLIKAFTSGKEGAIK